MYLIGTATFACLHYAELLLWMLLLKQGISAWPIAAALTLHPRLHKQQETRGMAAPMLLQTIANRVPHEKVINPLVTDFPP